MPRIAYERKRFGERRLAIIRLANQILEEYASQGFDLTLRQLYYQFVARDYLPNNVKSYGLLQGVVNDARMAGMIDWDHIVDRTRELKYLRNWENPAAAIKDWTERYFQTDTWADQPVRPEVWIEKDALVGVISQVCHGLDVSYFSCRGYTSQSEVWAASNRLREYIEKGQKVVILHLGDHDPSGIDMTRDIYDRLWTFITGDYWSAHPEYSGVNVQVTIESMFEVKRIALTMDQIEELKPPPNPAKLTDSRAKGYIEQFGDSSWELDALPPTTMADLIRGQVWELMDFELYDAAIRKQNEYVKTLELVSENWSSVVKALNKSKGA